MLDNTPVSFNEGFAKRKALLGTSSTVNCEIPLNRYSFFEALEDKLLPNTKIEINFEIEKEVVIIGCLVCHFTSTFSLSFSVYSCQIPPPKQNNRK